MSWQQVKIGSFLKRIKRPVEINDSVIYKRVTISSNHNGIKLRDTEIGAAIGTKNQFIVNEGDFILSKIDAMNGAFGIISSEVDEAIITGNFWAYNVDKDKVDSEWFLYFTHSTAFIDICKKSSTGTTHRKYLDEKIFLSYKLFLPDIDTQKKQVATFQNLNHHTNIIAKEVSRLREYLAKLKQSILQDAICGKLTEDWREANPNIEPASELLKRIKAEKQRQIKDGKIRKEKPLDPITDTDLPFTIPPTWQWCRLGVTGAMRRGKSKHRPRNDDSLFKNGIYPFIQTGDVSKAKYNSDIIKTVNGYYNELGLCQSEMQSKGTLCITIAANIAECGFLGFDACVPDSIVCYHSSHKETEQYVYYYLSIAKAELKKYAPATAQMNINLGILNALVIPLPPIEEQKRIVEIIKNSLEKCSLIEAQITANEQTAQNLIKSILSETFEKNNT